MPATWTTPDLDSLRSALTADELATLTSIGGDEGLSDAASEVIAEVVAEIRGHIAGCDRNQLGPEGTLPPELKSTFNALVRPALLARVPGCGILMDDARKEAVKRADKYLDHVRDCKVAVSAPANADADPAPTVAEAGGMEPLDWSGGDESPTTASAL